MQSNLDWMNEAMASLPEHNSLYKFLCFITGRRKRKFTYREWYVILRQMNSKEDGDDNGKWFALYQVMEIYKKNNGKYPKVLNGGEG